MDPYGHQYRIAQRTMELSKVAAQVMGGMNHVQAINVLKQHKWSEDRIARFMLRRGHSEREVLEFFRAARLIKNPGGNSSSTRRNPGIHREVYKGHTIEIHPDHDPQSPREWDNLGTMVCFHKRYQLGDKGHGYRTSDFNSWDELKAKIIRDCKAQLTILDMYMMDHSGLTVRTTSAGFRASDPQGFDWGKIGFIYAPWSKVRKEFSVKRITDKILTKVTDILRAEVDTYDQYLRGDVYGFTVINPDGSEGESVWGFYGVKDAVDAAKESIG